MSVLYIVLPLALIVVGAAVAAFVWATSRGQFDDLDTPGLRMLYDDAMLPAPQPDVSQIDPPAPSGGCGRESEAAAGRK
jgi:cbb3-type cytochrome oxidase maturation protein